MEKKETKTKSVKYKTTDEVLIRDYKTSKKQYKAGEKITVTEKGAEYLKTIKKIR